MRWTQPRHAAALLIDEDERLRVVDGPAEGVGERPELIGSVAIALKEDEPGGPLGGEQRHLLVIEGEPRAARDDRFHAHRPGGTTMQLRPAFSAFAHLARAAARSSSGPKRMR